MFEHLHVGRGAKCLCIEYERTDLNAIDKSEIMNIQECTVVGVISVNTCVDFMSQNWDKTEFFHHDFIYRQPEAICR